MKTTGWIYGQYLSCTLETAEENEYVHYLGLEQRLLDEDPSLRPRAYYDLLKAPGELWLQFYYSFRGGKFSPAIRPDELTAVEASGDFRVLTSPSYQTARISISGVYPSVFMQAKAKIVDGAFGSMPWINCVLGTDIRMGSSHPFGDSWADGWNRAYENVSAFTAAEFTRLTGAAPASREEDGYVSSETYHACPLMDNGVPSASSLYFYKFAGSFRGQGLRYTCFLVHHPDGSVTRTNTDYGTWKPATFDEVSTTQIGVSGDLYAANVDDLPGFPTSMINVAWDEKSGYTWGLAVTNGYIVYVLGPVATLQSTRIMAGNFQHPPS
jgi:hypothetical protein